MLYDFSYQNPTRIHFGKNAINKLANELKAYGENILLEEVAEAFNAYSQGKLEQSLQEFAQCGAVILRIMEKIDLLNAKT